MQHINPHKLNYLLGRSKLAIHFELTLRLFQQHINEFHKQGGIYVYGETGVGKTQFVKHVLKETGYNVVLYDGSHMRNTLFIENLSETKLSNSNVFQLFHRRCVKNAIVMDEVDGMNNNDKGGINALIQLIRQKKTKKQKLEHSINSPIISIGNMQTDKKIIELMKVCFKIKLNIPSPMQMENVIKEIHPHIDPHYLHYMIQYANGNLHKLETILGIYNKNIHSFDELVSLNTLQWTYFNEEAKTIVKKLADDSFPISCHDKIINDSDRTSVGLLWHENIIDLLSKEKTKKNALFTSIDAYRKQLDNICFADYIDRVTFQKQIWELGELSSLIKVFYNHYIYHQHKKTNTSIKEVRFTKILTKYSTEYGNISFLHRMCQQLLLDKKDLFSFFHFINEQSNEEMNDMLSVYDIQKIDYDRMIRFIDALQQQS